MLVERVRALFLGCACHGGAAFSSSNHLLSFSRHYNPRFVYFYPIFILEWFILQSSLYCRAVNISGFFFVKPFKGVLKETVLYRIGV
jgi:hypothetical protein